MTSALMMLMKFGKYWSNKVTCVQCGEEVGDPHYHIDDERQRYPLHRWCLKVVDLRLMLLEAQAQGEIDQLAESEI